MSEGRPLRVDVVDPEPVYWELEALNSEELLALLLVVEVSLPSVDLPFHLLDLSHKESHIVRSVNAQLFQLVSGALEDALELPQIST